MTDRELLELAAKAIGLTDPSDDDDIWRDAERGIDVQWNPLIDDGDVLRLAMALAAAGKLRIQVTGDDVTAFQHWDGVWVPITWTFDATNPSEAFRRAVVRAAAEIAKAMP